MKKSQAEHLRKPTFLYPAFIFAHTPLQAPWEYIDHCKEIYQKGWDAIREERFARQKKMGIIPANMKLPPREASWHAVPRDGEWSGADSVAGKSFLTITSLNAAAPRNVQFFEMRGNRAILSGDWHAVERCIR
jgi:arylsulfatase A-like enzyme